MKKIGIVAFVILGLFNLIIGITYLLRPVELNINSKIFGMYAMLLGLLMIVSFAGYIVAMKNLTQIEEITKEK